MIESAAARRSASIALLLAASVAYADDRHSVAVLSIVAKDTESARAASAITAALRAQVAGKASEYRGAGTAKEIDAATAAAECDPLQPRCTATIGAAIGADLVLAGELERRGTHQTLVLSLVETRTKQRVRSVHQTGAANADAKRLVRTAYARLAGGELGELAIVANAQQGEVSIDHQVVAGLFEGRTTIGGLVKGSHLLSIHAKGFRPLEIDVTVETATKQMLLLDPE